MITNVFILFASSILGFIISFFPSSNGLPAELQNAVTTLTGYVGMLDPIIPTIFAFNGLRWIFSYVPFINGN